MEKAKSVVCILMELIVAILVSSIIVCTLTILTKFAIEMFAISTACGIVFSITTSGIIIMMAAKRDA